MKLENHPTDQRMHLKTAPPIPSKSGSLMRRHYRSLFAVSLIVTASIFVVAAAVHPKSSSDPSAGQLPEVPPRNVRVQEVRGDGAASESSYTGMVRARYESDLAFRVGGKDPPTFTMRHNGMPAVGLGVAMVKGGNVLKLGEALEAELGRIEAALPTGVEVHTVAFQPHVVEESVGEFLRSFVEALVIVLVVSSL